MKNINTEGVLVEKAFKKILKKEHLKKIQYIKM